MEKKIPTSYKRHAIFKTYKEVLACNIGAMLAYIYSENPEQAAIFAKEAAHFSKIIDSNKK